MAIILDADVIIRGEKGTFDLKGWVTSHPNDRFEVAAITVAELWLGVERATGTHKVTRRRYLARRCSGVSADHQGELDYSGRTCRRLLSEGCERKRRMQKCQEQDARSPEIRRHGDLRIEKC
jgi:hypothetical protein